MSTTDDIPPLDEVSLESSVVARFEALAARHPERLAVEGDRQRLTYRELDALAERIAAGLTTEAPRDARVPSRRRRAAILLPKDAEQVAAFLGVLKAGWVAVVVDVSWPDQRLERVLAHAAPEVVLTREALLPRARLATGAALQVLDGARDPASARARVAIDPGAIACLVYTAGSTGEPKCVPRTHRTVLHQTASYARALALRPEDRLTLLSSLAVASGVSTAMLALLSSASLHLFELSSRELAELAPWLASHRITTWISAASLFRTFVAQLPSGADLSGVRSVKLGAEALRPSDVELWRRHFPEHGRLVLAFSSTETGLLTLRVLGKGDACRTVEDLAGWPVPGKRLTLVGEDGREVPTGEVGRVTVASRYLSTPTLDEAEQAPSSSVERTLTTQDLGRFTPEGSLVHVGRADGRVKVRGLSIDLGAIEAVLLEHPAVAEAVVVAVADARGETSLVAHVVGRTAPPSSAELRAHVARALSPAWSPARVQLHPRLPLTVNGKVDRAALRALGEGMDEAKEVPAAQAASGGALDAERLARFFARILELPSVSRHDDFFALGGSSLTAVTLRHALRREAGVDLSLAMLLEAPTPTLLAARLGQRPPRSNLVPLRPTGSRAPLFVLHPSLGDVLCYRGLVAHLPTDLPVLGLEAVGMNGDRPRLGTVEAMARHHATEIERQQPSGPLSLAGYSLGGLIAHATARELSARGRTVAFLGLFDSSASFDPRPFRLRYLGMNYLWRAQHHVSMIRSTSGRERLEYVWGRARLMLWRLSLPGVSENRGRPEVAYRPGPYAGRVTLFRASSRFLFEHAEASNGWSKETCGALEVRPVPGDHFSIMLEPCVRVLAEGVERALREAGL